MIVYFIEADKVSVASGFELANIIHIIPKTNPQIVAIITRLAVNMFNPPLSNVRFVYYF